MKLRILAAAAALALIAPAANATTYFFDSSFDAVGAATISGWVATNGTIGTLTAADITNWNIVIQEGANSYDLTGPLSGNDSTGHVLQGVTATSTGLFLDFSNSLMEFYFLDRSSANQLSFGVNEEFVYIDGYGYDQFEPFCTLEVATITGSGGSRSCGSVATPEPATWSLMLAGWAGLGAMLRRRAARVARV